MSSTLVQHCTNVIQMFCVCWVRSQQTQNICITFVQRRPHVFDVGPALYKCYTNVLCLLGEPPAPHTVMLISAISPAEGIRIAVRHGINREYGIY